MTYFIPWVVFLVAVILSVPVFNWLEKRKLRAELGDQPVDEELGEADEEAVEEPGDEAEAVAEPADGGDEIAEDEFAALE